ncbi:hypothetical protein HOY82DRAFT_604854 [Tuber indicum]|nr:hypothetical protein HOY82DRAFT_604854 [Tuber indicum]
MPDPLWLSNRFWKIAEASKHALEIRRIRQSRWDTQNPATPPMTRSIASPHTLSRMNDGARIPLYDFANRGIRSLVDRASGIGRRSIDSLKTACKTSRTTITTVILQLYIEGEELGAPLFTPWTIKDQNMATSCNTRKWFLLVKDMLGGMIV